MFKIYTLFLIILALECLASSPNALLKKGNQAFEEGKIDVAKENYGEALKQLPDNPYLLYNQGVAAYAEKNYGQALEQFQNAHKQSLSGKEHDVAFESQCLASSGDALYSQAKQISELPPEQAGQQLENAIKLNDAAQKAYGEAIAVNPKNTTAGSALNQAKLLNKKLLALKYMQPPQQQQQQQQQQDNKDKQDKQDQDNCNQQPQQDNKDNKQQQQDQQQDQQQQEDKQQEQQEQQKEQQQEEDKQQEQKEEQQSAEEKEEQAAEEEQEREAKEIIDQEKQDKKERQKILQKQMKIQPVQQDW